MTTHRNPDQEFSKASVRECNSNESDDGYSAVVTRLNERWRIIVCRNGIQWILQRAKLSGPGVRWRSVSYCTTREALKRCVARSIGEIDAIVLAVLNGLPNIIGEAADG